VFAPLLVMLGLSGKRRTDRLTVELGTQVSFARAAARFGSTGGGSSEFTP
jgi:hypothetical protein